MYPKYGSINFRKRLLEYLYNRRNQIMYPMVDDYFKRFLHIYDYNMSWLDVWEMAHNWRERYIDMQASRRFPNIYERDLAYENEYPYYEDLDILFKSTLHLQQYKAIYDFGCSSLQLKDSVDFKVIIKTDLPIRKTANEQRLTEYRKLEESVVAKLALHRAAVNNTPKTKYRTVVIKPIDKKSRLKDAGYGNQIYDKGNAKFIASSAKKTIPDGFKINNGKNVSFVKSSVSSGEEYSQFYDSISTDAYFSSDIDDSDRTEFIERECISTSDESYSDYKIEKRQILHQKYNISKAYDVTKREYIKESYETKFVENISDRNFTFEDSRAFTQKNYGKYGRAREIRNQDRFAESYYADGYGGSSMANKRKHDSPDNWRNDRKYNGRFYHPYY